MGTPTSSTGAPQPGKSNCLGFQLINNHQRGNKQEKHPAAFVFQVMLAAPNLAEVKPPMGKMPCLVLAVGTRPRWKKP